MINRTQIETVLKVNGVGPESDDEVIKSILLSARYNADEVDAAIMVLRENTVTNKTRVDGLHKIFRTDEGLSAEEITSLLGIPITADQLPEKLGNYQESSSFRMAFVWVLSVLLAVSGILIYMYLYKIGLFHPTVGLAYFNDI